MKILIEMFLDNNLGDDLFLDTLLDRYTGYKFYLEVPKEYKINEYFKQYKNLYLIEKKINLFYKILEISLLMSLFRAYKYDAFIYIGGSIFEIKTKQDVISKIKQYLKYKIRKLFKKKIFIMGANLGPFNIKTGEKIIKKIITLAEGIVVRDKKSIDILKKWNINEKKYKYGSDIVFINKILKLKSELVKVNSNVLGISIINKKASTLLEKKIYKEKIIEIIKEYLRESEKNSVELFAFDTGREMSDVNLLLKIYENLSEKEKKKVKNQLYLPNISLDKYIENFLKCEFIICGRFHSVILALGGKCKFISISYSEKIDRVLEDLEENNKIISYSGIGRIKTKSILELVKKATNNKKNNDYKKTAENHFVFFDRWRKNEK